MDNILDMAIVAVDDDLTYLAVIAHLLKKNGFTRAQCFSSSTAAWAQVSETPPDLLLLDVTMPELDGFSFCRRVRSCDDTSHVPIIMITSDDDEQTLKASFEAGAIDFIAKPISPIVFLTRVKSALALKRSHDLLKTQNELLIKSNDEIQILNHQVQRDLDLAERIFSKIIHRENPDAPNVRFLISPAKNVSGDILFASSTPAGEQHILLGDFTGHGLSAAIGATSVARVFSSMSAKGFSIGDIMEELNDQLRLILPTGLFCCACLIALDNIKRKTQVLNCGLPDVLVIGAQGKLKRRFPSKLIPLGLVPIDNYHGMMEEMAIEDGDHIYVYSDGIIEAVNPQGEMFSQSLLEKTLTGIPDVNQGFEEIQKALREFCATAEQQDDITLADIRCAVTSVQCPVAGQGQMTQYGSSDWQIRVNLSPPRLPHNNLAMVLYEMMEQNEPALKHHKINLYLILSELYNNALEHGLLGLDCRLKATPEGFESYYTALHDRLAALDQGWIKVDVLFYRQDTGRKLVVRMEDSGRGFDFRQVISQPPDEKCFSGRGVSLVRSLCQELVYNDQGNAVEAVYVWQEPAEDKA
ncbi:MAG: fused response regulator/phosphatase [Deltaproteobacteria bacterium]|nr:fused response regulator/phosphatase [Deltaproteobacteria bacterium]